MRPVGLLVFDNHQENQFYARSSLLNVLSVDCSF